MGVTDQLAKTDMLDTERESQTKSADPSIMSVLVVVRHNGVVRSFEGYANGVTLTTENYPWYPFLVHHELNVAFEGEVIERVVKE